MKIMLCLSISCTFSFSWLIIERKILYLFSINEIRKWKIEKDKNLVNFQSGKIDFV